MRPFGERLHAATGERGPLCVGIDPHVELLRAWGLEDSPAGLERFGRTVVEAVGDRVALLKPQSAFYERHGSAGIAALERTVADARERGCLVLLDVKRGDIGSTARAYAEAYLVQSSPLAVDAITVSPFLGTGSLDPVLDTAESEGAGAFVLALTSNPEGPQVQHARTAEGLTVAGAVLAAVARRNAGQGPHGSVGVVVGATIEPPEEDLAVGGPILAPGVGEQGGSAESVRRVFAGVLDRVLPASSRAVLRAGPSVTRLQEAAEQANDAFRTLVAP